MNSFDHFTQKEKSCKCGCGLNLVDRNIEFLKALNSAREIANIPFVVNCMTRCEKHNKEVGGEPHSSHMRGLACDISCTDSISREKIIKALLTTGFNRIGIAKTFIHCDMDTSLPQNVIWVY